MANKYLTKGKVETRTYRLYADKRGAYPVATEDHTCSHCGQPIEEGLSYFKGSINNDSRWFASVRFHDDHRPCREEFIAEVEADPGVIKRVFLAHAGENYVDAPKPPRPSRAKPKGPSRAASGAKPKGVAPASPDVDARLSRIEGALARIEAILKD